MRKTSFFDDHWGNGWPELGNIQSCLTDGATRARFFAKGRDGGSFFIERPFSGQKIALYMHMHPEHGVKLQYSKPNAHLDGLETYHSKGDVSRLREFVRSFHDTPLSIGLFVTFDAGWQAVREFLATEGELPGSIEWVNDIDVPSQAFPAP